MPWNKALSRTSAVDLNGDTMTSYVWCSQLWSKISSSEKGMGEICEWSECCALEYCEVSHGGESMTITTDIICVFIKRLCETVLNFLTT